jgi:phosphoribosyl-dephospho-CoA transferase
VRWLAEASPVETRYRPHDLLFLGRTGAFDTEGAWPEWLDAAWLEAAPLVVRRAAPPPGRLPVGVRGLQRNQRCAGHLPAGDVARCVTPEMLALGVLEDHAGQASIAGSVPALPCIAALLALAPRLQALGLDWGPVGGAGFWLASGLPVLRPTSDLDLLVRAPQPLAPAAVAELLALQQHAACRIDIQVDTGSGGFALMEYARGGKLMLKTDHGPRLVTDPWAVCEEGRETA